jgi:flagellar motor protein MotB
MQEIPSVSNMAENLITTNTPEGFLIQLVDQENTSMFASGGTELQESLTKIL